MKYVGELVNDLDMALPWFMRDPDPSTYLTGPYLVLDFETTTLEYGNPLNPDNRLICAAWYMSGVRSRDAGKVHVHFGGELDQDQLLEDIETVLASGGFIVAHNLKFELQWLARCGIDLHDVLGYDTMIGEYVLAGNRRWKLSLNATAQRYGCTPKASLVDDMLTAGVCTSQMPPDFVRARVVKDVKDTTRVFRRQRRRLEDAGQLQLQWTRCIFTPVLAHIEMQGIKLDHDRVYEEYDKTLAEYQIAEREFHEFTGGVSVTSPKQMAEYVYGELGFSELRYGGRTRGKPIRNKPTKTFPDGAPKVDSDTLDALDASTQKQRDFVVLRKRLMKLGSALSKTLEFFKGIVDEYDGVFYGQFNQCVTATHRLSSSGRSREFKQFAAKNGKPKTKGIQLQNMPGAYKDLIGPKVPGNKIGDIDGSQLEFRGAAFVGQDEQAIWNIRHDVDQHAFTASQLLGIAVHEVNKKQRGAAKPDTFKPLYGGTRGTPEQERYYAWFREEFPQLAEVQAGWTFTVLADKKLRMPWGMEFHFPYCRQDDRTGYIDSTPSIYNYPIQNIATAEIIPVAITYLWHRIHANDADITLINTVHDSATGEFPESEEARWRALGVQTFTMDVYQYLDTVYGLDFNVPLGVGVSVGDRWESPDATEWEANVEADGEYWLKGERA